MTSQTAIRITVLEETGYFLDVDRNEAITQLANICVTPAGDSYSTEQIAEVLANAWDHRWELGSIELDEWLT